MGLNKILNDIIRKQIACGFVMAQENNQELTLEQYLINYQTTLKTKDKEIKKISKQILKN